MNETQSLKNLHINLLNTQQIVFPVKGKIRVSVNHGVYIIYSPRNKVLYVGTTKRGGTGLNQRLNNHLYKQSTFNKLFLRPRNISLRTGYKFRYIEVVNSRKRALLEALTAGLLCPEYFGTGERKN